MGFEDIIAADNAALFDPDLLGMPGVSVETADYKRGNSMLKSGLSLNIERGDLARIKDFRSAGEVSPQTVTGKAWISAGDVASPKYQDKIIAADGTWTVLRIASTEARLHEVVIERDMSLGFK